MTVSRGRRATGPTICKYPLSQGICAALVKPNSPQPDRCAAHRKEADQ